MCWRMAVLIQEPIEQDQRLDDTRTRASNRSPWQHRRLVSSSRIRQHNQDRPPMSKAVRIDRNGGPEELKIVDVEVGDPGPGEIRIRHKAVGLNFIDTYQRSGLYPLPMPLHLGMEASGIVEAVGEGVSHLKVGDRAAYASQPPGAYCEVRVMPARCVCKLPDAISFETGAAMMLKGLTAQYL